MCADTKAVNLVALFIEADDGFLIDIITCHDLDVLQPVNIEPKDEIICYCVCCAVTKILSLVL